jgi:hypothetical protein
MAESASGLSSTAAGLRLVDTANWTYRKLAPDVSNVQLLAGTLLATGASSRFDGTSWTQSGAGLLAYSLDGHERYHVLGDAQVSVVGGYAEVPSGRGKQQAFVLDVATGELGRAVQTSPFRLLVPGRLAPYGP